jgi:hypothetical protein
VKQFIIATLLVLATAAESPAMWQVYSEDAAVIAAYDYDSFAPLKGAPRSGSSGRMPSRKAAREG